MNRRRFLTTMAGVAAFAMLPGCGLGSLAPASEPVNLRCAVLPGLLPSRKGRQVMKTLDAWAEELHAARANLTVALEELSYDDLMTGEGAFALDLLFGENSEFDTLMAGADMLPQLREQQLIASLESYLQSTGASLREDFVAALFDSLLDEGQAWALPVGFNPVVVRYNRTLFEQVGLPEPRSDWTWEEFVETVTLLNGALPDRQFALGLGCSDVLPMIHALGGRLFDDNASPMLHKLNEAGTVAAFDELAGLVSRGLLPDPERVQAYEPSSQDSEAVQSITMAVMGEGGEDADVAEMQAIANYGLRLSMAAANGDAAIWVGSLEEGIHGGMGSLVSFAGPATASYETGIALLPRREAVATLAGVGAHCLVAASSKQKETWPWLTLVADKVPPVGLPARRSQLLSPESRAELGDEAATVALALSEHLDELELITPVAAALAYPVALALWRSWNGADPTETLDEAAAEVQQSLDQVAAN